METLAHARPKTPEDCNTLETDFDIERRYADGRET